MTSLTPAAHRALALADAVGVHLPPWQEPLLAGVAEGRFPYIVMTNREAARTHRQALELWRTAGKLTADETDAARAIVNAQSHTREGRIDTELFIGHICHPALAEGDPEPPISETGDDRG